MKTPLALFADLSDSHRGILWMLLTTLLFVFMDTIAKYLTGTYPVPQITWARYAFHALALAVLFRRRLPALMRTKRLGLQILRSSLLFSATILSFFALRVMPLADVVAIWAITPILVTAFSVPLLGERVGPRRWAGVGAGFVGAIIIIRPGMGVMQAAAILPASVAVVLAFYHLATRALSSTDSSTTTIVYTVIVGLLVSTAAVPFYWVTPDASAWILMVVLGLLGMASHFSLIKSFEVATAATVIPYTYTNLIWATVVGFVVFGDLPDRWTVIGAGVIVAGGLYIFHREHHGRRPRETS
ncbi:MAG: DMT family transporter [Rhodospirillales bacterium]|jgi:drug/metabolite transporter (DMT)-like permease|nr:DMT family transporter [Rhodospirillales bacterium]